MIIDSVVDQLQSVGVVLRELEKVLGLDLLVDDTVDDAKGLEVQLSHVVAGIRDLVILLVEVRCECRTPVSSERLRPVGTKVSD